MAAGAGWHETQSQKCMLEAGTLQLPSRAAYISISHNQRSRSKADSETRKVCRSLCPRHWCYMMWNKQISFKGSICLLFVCVEKSRRILCIRSLPIAAARITTRSRRRSTWYIRIHYLLTRSPTYICTVKLHEEASLWDVFPGTQAVKSVTSCPSLLFMPRSSIPSRTDVAPHYSVPPAPYASLTPHLPTTAAIFIRLTTWNFTKYTVRQKVSHHDLRRLRAAWTASPGCEVLAWWLCA